MFKKNDDTSKELDDVQTLIGPSIEVRGDFEGEGDVIVEGKLSGTLKTKKDLRVGPEAKIEADVEAENIFVAGEIKGNVKAREAIEFGESSIMNGDVETKSLVIEKGAIFNGSCSMADDGGQMTGDRDEEETAKKAKKEQGKLDEVGEIFEDEDDDGKGDDEE